MEWSDLKLFLAIARFGTLGAAARSLGLTQPTMGRRLRALEASLGQTLFQRTTDGFVLTDEGTAVFAGAERIEEEALAMERVLAGGSRQLDGFLRLSSSDWFGAHVLSPVLAEFSQVHPKVEIELLTDSRLLNLSRREADLVFRIRPFTEAEVISRKLIHIEYGLYIRRGAPHPEAGDGTGARLITMDEAFSDMPDVGWLQRLLPRADTVMRSNSRDVQAALCANGAGLAVLPRPLGDSLAVVELVDLGEPPPGRDTWVGYHRDMKRLARLRALLDLVIERLAR
ncbi:MULTISPECIES: LysR family transcriptional regulator [Rhizobium]|uniref:HTH-type transcriptional regulator TtuA n=1 Tax=Rhizobium anhuiense TaxID=1184720 RepID=A0A3S0Q9Q8_9HYPH|nr:MULTISPECIES: LysR family transcriptional regulator [Rhizobium]MBB3297601.1 DNA-binding transcriptional LysR family regulator [Rhizobium sp. BK112]MBB3367002.1 DNA-binding transcriptional LysR family regulator [Rhizobium sp. BK077]MBB3745472.1 DNA-binding transcriptional LysR family regulator [Rhizobium sp. BK591]MBB4115651.1 DNA-binding transcriptional LysR family regulator [Rhizobium sp. BK226]MBB4177904.1 DNA-binding transcriptional LysR family regulator [Rhizobium sp. BK109]